GNPHHRRATRRSDSHIAAHSANPSAGIGCRSAVVSDSILAGSHSRRPSLDAPRADECSPSLGQPSRLCQSRPKWHLDTRWRLPARATGNLDSELVFSHGLNTDETPIRDGLTAD